VAAANALLDRGYGKPTQPIPQTLAKVDPSAITDEEPHHTTSLGPGSLGMTGDTIYVDAGLHIVA
jgi:hypothetical protein